MSQDFRDMKLPLVKSDSVAEASALNLENGRIYSSLETYIRFQLGGQSFCLPAESIRGVTGTQGLISAVYAGFGMVGFVFSQGQTLPVLDLRPRLNLHPSELSKKSSIVLVSMKDEPRLRAGIVVEELETTIRFSADRLKNRHHDTIPVQYLRGLVYEGADSIWVLDLECLLNPVHLRRLETLSY